MAATTAGAVRRRVGAAALAAAAWPMPAGCAGDDPDPAPAAARSASPAATGSAVPRSALLPPVAAYVDAVNGKDLDALTKAFAPDGQVVDVGRRFAGRDAIRGWADREVIGGALTVRGVVERRDGYQKLLVTFAPGGSGGFAAHYAFTVSGSAITRADLTYAN
ncbi:nuclear transport factor 2 family protein [Actinomadura namibiensis]|uniref:SnoaL-like domain-containing protein n=1 Tax=Actinomadura namibiensis TaxID=182080 RepID=A0A7W3LQ91_ACTNM|nr:nuclear transport factor 2 family protein [Actinomadura namibiensis]MBA8952185.1 hypothetical protein [Actinomadura namibiensis]